MLKHLEKPTASVLRWSILTSALLTLSGCGFLNPFSRPEVKQVEIQTRAVERARLNIPDPAAVKFGEIRWRVVTPENVDAVFKELAEGNTDLVLFALTDDGYEQLATDLAELRAWIIRQKQVAEKYRQYYEPAEKKETAQ